MIHSTLSSMVAANEKTNLISSEIRAAYADGDGKASREYHDSKKQGASEDGHQSGGGLLKPIIFGGLDGILTSFAIVAGAAGGRLPPSTVLILGFSNMFADALSMGVGEFLSSKAENEWILSERDRETWEMENYREGEIQEMIEIYESKGMSHEDAELVIKTMSKYQDFFVDIMMTQELALQVPERDHVQGSMREGLVMFCSFAFFGSLPLLGYVVIPTLFPSLREDALFITACVVTSLVLFFMGCVKSFILKMQWFRSGMETLLLGGSCATVAYTIGQFVQHLTGESV